MKKFLSFLAIILVIIALILLMYAAYGYLGSASSFSTWLTTASSFGALTWGQVLLLAGAGLLIAAVLSPKAFTKSIDRVSEGFSKVAGGVTKIASKTAAGAVGGIVGGLLGDGNWIYVLAGGALLYLLWPTSKRTLYDRDELIGERIRGKVDKQFDADASRLSSTMTSEDSNPETIMIGGLNASQ